MVSLSATATGIDGASLVQLGRNHFSVEHGGQPIVMSISAGQYLTFDDIGFAIWQALKESVRVDDLVDTLATEYDAPRDQVKTDVLAFLRKLDEYELLSVA